MPMPGIAVPRKDIEWLVRGMAAHYELPVEETVRQVEALSGFERVSIKGSKRYGLMGISDALAKNFKIKHKDWRDNVAGGTRIMASYRKRFDGDYVAALAAYEEGVETVADLMARFRAKWLLQLRPETQELIAKVTQKNAEENAGSDKGRASQCRAA